MIAYNKEKLLETLWLSDVEDLRSAGFIGRKQYEEATLNSSRLKSNPNIFLRIFMAVVGFLLYGSISMAIGMLSFLSDVPDAALFLVTIAFIILTEFLVYQEYFRYGLDDAGILSTQAVIAGLAAYHTESSTAVFAVMTIFGILGTIRYVHSLSVLVAIVGMIGSVSVFITESGALPGFSLPFFLLALAVSLLYAESKLRKTKAADMYRDVLDLAKWASLVLLYLSGNYLVVREGASELLHFTPEVGEDIPAAWIFYGLTFAIPLAYIAFGIRKKDRPMLWIGICALAFSFYSIRFYYQLLPIEVALLMAGAVLFGIGFFAYWKLIGREKGITYEPDRFVRSESFKLAEMVIANSQTNPAQPSSGPMEFGGGDFSGGGGSSGY